MISNVNQRPNSNKKKIHVDSTFVSGPMLNFKGKLKNLWKKHCIYINPLMNNIHLKIGVKSNKVLKQLFVKASPLGKKSIFVKKFEIEIIAWGDRPSENA
jgi:hypothetical protein